MLFLNCGLRVSELCGIDIGDIKEETLRVLGKGQKERVVYLNDATQNAITEYLQERSKVTKIRQKDAVLYACRNTWLIAFNRAICRY